MSDINEKEEVGITVEDAADEIAERMAPPLAPTAPDAQDVESAESVESSENMAPDDNDQVAAQVYQNAVQTLRNVQTVDAETNWKELREYDPAEFAVRRQELQEAAAKAQHELTAAAQYTLGKQHDKLLQLIPEWENPEVASAQKEEIRTYLKRQGMSQAEIDNLNDARAVVIAREAWLSEKNSKRRSRRLKVPKRPRPKTPKDYYSKNETQTLDDFPSSMDAAAIKIQRLL